MKLITAVNAFLAAQELAGETLPWAFALAVARVKKACESDMTFFSQQEMKLVDTYARKDENGNPLISPEGRFQFQDAQGKAGYDAARKLLMDTEIDPPMSPLDTVPPESIRPEWILALEPFLTFREVQP